MQKNTQLVINDYGRPGTLLSKYSIPRSFQSANFVDRLQLSKTNLTSSLQKQWKVTHVNAGKFAKPLKIHQHGYQPDKILKIGNTVEKLQLTLKATKTGINRSMLNMTFNANHFCFSHLSIEPHRISAFCFGSICWLLSSTH